MTATSFIRPAARFVLAVVVGYATMILLITLVQEGIFGGVGYYKTPLPQLLVAGVLTTASALAGGAVATYLARRPGYLPACVMCGLVALETTYLIATGVLTDPLWFDFLAALGLLVGILAGAFAVRRWRQAGSSQAGIPAAARAPASTSG